MDPSFSEINPRADRTRPDFIVMMYSDVIMSRQQFIAHFSGLNNRGVTTASDAVSQYQAPAQHTIEIPTDFKYNVSYSYNHRHILKDLFKLTELNFPTYYNTAIYDAGVLHYFWWRTNFLFDSSPAMRWSIHLVSKVSTVVSEALSSLQAGYCATFLGRFHTYKEFLMDFQMDMATGSPLWALIASITSVGLSAHFRVSAATGVDAAVSFVVAMSTAYVCDFWTNISVLSLFYKEFISIHDACAFLVHYTMKITTTRPKGWNEYLEAECLTYMPYVILDGYRLSFVTNKIYLQYRSVPSFVAFYGRNYAYIFDLYWHYVSTIKKYANAEDWLLPSELFQAGLGVTRDLGTEHISLSVSRGFSRVARVLDGLTGRMKFLLSGGESNPGPVFSRLLGVDYIREQVLNLFSSMITPTLMSAKQKAQLFGESALNFIHLLRLYTTITDLLSVVFFRTTTALDLVARVTSFCLNAYETFKAMGLEVVAPRIGRMQAGGMDTLVLSALISSTAPEFVKKILKDMPCMTTMKVLDDVSYLYDIFGFLLSIPRRVLAFFKSTDDDSFVSVLTKMLYSMECIFPFSHVGALQHKMDAITSVFKKEPKLMLDDAHQKRFMDMDKEVVNVEHEILTSRRVLPSYFVGTMTAWKKYKTKILKYKSNVRVEPVLIIMRGPKGSGKTTMMNSLIEMYVKSGMTAFSDTLPATLESKHFMDTYDDEDIVVIDDLGSRGKCEYSEFVKWVSTAKCMLNAADIANKNMKYFNSRLIMATTNVIPKDFGSKDGVSDKEALYRRMLVFDFKDVKFTGVFHGKISVQRYDDTLGVQRFVQKFELDTEDVGFYPAVDAVINNELTRKVADYKANKARLEGHTMRPFPSLETQSKTLDDFRNMVTVYCRDMFNNIATMVQLMVDFTDTVVESLRSCCEMKTLGVVFALAMVAYGVYSFFSTDDNKEKEEPVKKKVFEHRTNRGGKMSSRNVYMQSLTVDERGFELPYISSLAKFYMNVCTTRFIFVNKSGVTQTQEARSIFSMNRAITVAHTFLDWDGLSDVFIEVYREGLAFYDKALIRNLTMHDKYDVATFELQNMPVFKKKIHKPVNNSTKRFLAIGNGTIVNVNDTNAQFSYEMMYSPRHKLEPTDELYSYQADGLCGSPLITEEGLILGLHVAVGEDDTHDGFISYGLTRLWSTEFRDQMYDFLDKGVGFVLGYDKDKKFPSGVKLDREGYAVNYMHTSYGESAIHGAFPLYRKPALSLPKEMKDLPTIAETMMDATPVVDIKALDFALLDLNQSVSNGKFATLSSEEELVIGNDIMGDINKTTSSGYIYANKIAYIDYENKKLTDRGKEIVQEHSIEIVHDQYSFSDYATLTPKDELKDIADLEDFDTMPKKIRVFTNYHLVMTFYIRFFFMNFFTHIMKNKFENGIMIGLNPFSEDWEKMYRILVKRGRKVFDADYKNYDRYMNPMFQRYLNKFLRDKVDLSTLQNFNKVFGTHYTNVEIEKILDQVLECIISTPILARNMFIMTTHGLPSGMALTSFYNSLINKMYLSYSWFLTHGKNTNLTDYYNKVKVFVYGDDVIGSVDGREREVFSPVRIQKVIQSIGLDLLPGNKDPIWIEENQWLNIEDSTFLKRTFYYHDKLKQIVAPLNPITLEGTLNYVSDVNRKNELTLVKMSNAQREAFLHNPFYYNNIMLKLQKASNDNNLGWVPLKEDYLMEMYKNDGFIDLLY